MNYIIQIYILYYIIDSYFCILISIGNNGGSVLFQVYESLNSFKINFLNEG